MATRTLRQTGVTWLLVPRIIILSAAMTLLSLNAHAAPITTGRSTGMDFQVTRIANGLGIPWGMAFVSESELLITSRDGRLSRVDVNTGNKTEIDGLPDVAARGQGGLLDVAVPADYADTPIQQQWIYFTYSKPPSTMAATALARAQLSPGDSTLKNWQDLLLTQSAGSGGRHFGSRIAFDQAGHVYFGIGDRGERDNGQDLSTHASTIVRLQRDGQIPADNPFINTPGALPEIWSYGHRNPQGMAYDPVNDRLWSSEHGPRGGDEINLIEKGNNYGWADVSLGKEYFGPLRVGVEQKAGMVDPVKSYVPSIAPGSLLLYQGDAFPNWRGNLFLGALKLRHLNRVTLDNSGNALGEERLLEGLDQRIRSLVEGPNGFLYLGVDAGELWVLQPKDN